MHPDIRPATPDDVPDLLRLIHELAVYEREPDAVETTEADLAAALFPATGEPTAHAHVVETGEGGALRCEGLGPTHRVGASKGGDRRVVGMALWFLTFSTWTGRNGIHLEDLYVEEDHRGAGLGKALLTALADLCRERGYPRLEWTVLTWNTPSIAFYESLGARPQDEWMTYRLSGAALADVPVVER